MELSLVVDSKFKVYNYPPALPNKCVGCLADHPGDRNERAFIDTGMTLDWYGAVYICTLCMKEMANAFGYVSSEQYNRATDLLREMTNSFKQTWRENESLRTAVSSLSNHRCVVPNESDISGVFEPAAQEREAPAELAPVGNHEESDTPESPGVEGLPDVRGNADVHAGNSGSKSGKRKPEPDPLDDLL